MISGKVLDCIKELRLKVVESNTESKPIMVELITNGKTLQMELDTGSAVSFMSKHEYKQLFGNVKLRPCKMILQTYSGEKIHPIGIVDFEGQRVQNWNYTLRKNWKLYLSDHGLQKFV